MRTRRPTSPSDDSASLSAKPHPPMGCLRGPSVAQPDLIGLPRKPDADRLDVICNDGTLATVETDMDRLSAELPDL